MNAESMNSLVDLFVEDDTLVSYVQTLLDERVKDGSISASQVALENGDLENMIDLLVDEAFGDLNIWEMVAASKRDLLASNASNTANTKQPLEIESRAYNSADVPRPSFSPSEPVRVTTNPGRRHKPPTPPSIGKQSPKAKSPGSGSKARMSPASASSSSQGEQATSAAVRSPIGAPKQTISPDIVEGSPSRSGGGLFESSPSAASRTSHGRSVSSTPPPESGPSFVASPMSVPASSPGSGLRITNTDIDMSGDDAFSPASYHSPTPSKSRGNSNTSTGRISHSGGGLHSNNNRDNSGRSPGSNLEDDDFDERYEQNRSVGIEGTPLAYDAVAEGELDESLNGSGMSRLSNSNNSELGRSPLRSPGSASASASKASKRSSPATANTSLNESALSRGSRSSLMKGSSPGGNSPSASANRSPGSANRSANRSSTNRSPGASSFDGSPAVDPFGGGQGLDFSKRYKFNGDFPEEDKDVEEEAAPLDMNTWLLAQSQGNPLESSFASSSSRSPARSATPPLGSNKSTPNGSIGRSPLSGSKSASGSPSHRYSNSNSLSESLDSMGASSLHAPSPMQQRMSPTSSGGSPGLAHTRSPPGRFSPSKGSPASVGTASSSSYRGSPRERGSSRSLHNSANSSPMVATGASSSSKATSPLSYTHSTSPAMGRGTRSSPGNSPAGALSPKMGVSSRNLENPMMRTVMGSSANGLGLGGLDTSMDEDGSLTAGPAVYDGEDEEPEREETYGDDDFNNSMNNSGPVDYGSDDGNVEKLSDAGALSPDSFALKYGANDESYSSPHSGALNSSIESGDNVAYGSDFEEANDNDVSEDFGDDFEDLEEGEDDGKRRVRFKPKPVSDIFITRDKYTHKEVRDLFYTHDEALQFSVDYSKETHRAEVAGMTWYDWWEERTEVQWESDDIENEKLSAAWSDSNEGDGNSVEEYFEELSDEDNEFSNF